MPRQRHPSFQPGPLLPRESRRLRIWERHPPQLPLPRPRLSISEGRCRAGLPRGHGSRSGGREGPRGKHEDLGFPSVSLT